MLNSIKSLLVEKVEPDQWDLQMMTQAQKVNDGQMVSFDEMLATDGFTYADLQN